MAEKCSNCQFGESPGKYSDFRYCVRYPPKVLRTEIDRYQNYRERSICVWPEVFEDQWCGEYRPKPPIPEEAEELRKLESGYADDSADDDFELRVLREARFDKEGE